MATCGVQVAFGWSEALCGLLGKAAEDLSETVPRVFIGQEVLQGGTPNVLRARM